MELLESIFSGKYTSFLRNITIFLVEYIKGKYTVVSEFKLEVELKDRKDSETPIISKGSLYVKGGFFKNSDDYDL